MFHFYFEEKYRQYQTKYFLYVFILLRQFSVRKGVSVCGVSMFMHGRESFICLEVQVLFS